ncbi:methyltransferase domain-containing protein [Psychrobacillus sp. NEAU-3TGS]|uniref:methyltransferase domain-containing protein n=1 Tax=Psychrobacillus sp. NEAU-3TGS TaxID=2995412 RepID=UPI002497936E|nr:methyltransferase domain-containing protein [Psychrobacillus sp. NEAU-3TGS]MDI2588687.1 methyltransferase domain-containing protein [Psychrobacillus sp. NEAU-3TGS]
MEKYYWDTQLEYLKRTRDLYYNDDYLEFLVNSVWKISKPVHIIDFGCGYGYLGLKLLPLLPKGSKYTGIDKGQQLINKAIEYFHSLPYESKFFVADTEEIEIEDKYDIAVCHAFLLHISEPQKMLQIMVNSIVNDGKIICFEPHWISGMSSYELGGYEQSQIVPLGILQKLFEESKTDGNIGAKVPKYLSELGVKNIECRVSDKVNFLYSDKNQQDKKKLFYSLKEDGVGGEIINKDYFIESLTNRGVTLKEAQEQFEAELLFSQVFNMDSSLIYAPSMKITFGDIKKC